MMGDGLCKMDRIKLQYLCTATFTSRYIHLFRSYRCIHIFLRNDRLQP